MPLRRVPLAVQCTCVVWPSALPHGVLIVLVRSAGGAPLSGSCRIHLPASFAAVAIKDSSVQCLPCCAWLAQTRSPPLLPHIHRRPYAPLPLNHAAFASKDSWVQYLRQAGLRVRVHPEDTGAGADLAAVEFAICELQGVGCCWLRCGLCCYCWFKHTTCR